MLMKVVLAEKPSVAREIAQFLRAGSRHEGYFEGSGYQVTWAYGHLVTLKEPDEYDPAWKKWSLDTLPILPERFELKTVDDKLSRKQFSVVKQLFRAADEIICATDAGREGELIFRYIQTLTGCAKKPFLATVAQFLDSKAIREAFDKLRPGREYDDLYAAARCRSEADWIVGMNGTRNFTVRFGGSGMLWSVGRVQTPCWP
jgi:DNA topoisomerase III